jgi:hypothetical protein
MLILRLLWIERTARVFEGTANSVIMLILRSLWIEQTARMFEGTATIAGRVLDGVMQEWTL